MFAYCINDIRTIIFYEAIKEKRRYFSVPPLVVVSISTCITLTNPILITLLLRIQHLLHHRLHHLQVVVVHRHLRQLVAVRYRCAD